MTRSTKVEQPQKPLLVGILVDVSGSMATNLRNRNGETLKRLERVQQSLDDLVARARALRDEGGHDAREFGLFVYGFGLGNLRDLVLGRKVPPVANLLFDDPMKNAVVSSGDLFAAWPSYKDRIEAYSASMLGATPMLAALERASTTMTVELASGRFADDRLLFVLSDGLPTDGGPNGGAVVRSTCEALKRQGVTILSCYISDDDVTLPRTLYAEPPPEWSQGARLMFDCASPLPQSSVFWPHLHEFDWTAPPGARLFAQINQSEDLTAFIETLLGPIGRASHKASSREQRVFVSYSHADAAYVEEAPGSLLYYLRGLEHENVRLWTDRRIPPGAQWDEAIKEQLRQASVALVLVSQAFLSSEYCNNVEIAELIRRRTNEGLAIIPVLLSACEWPRHDWLAATQMLPRDGRTVEGQFGDSGRRKELYLEILSAIRAAVQPGT